MIPACSRLQPVSRQRTISRPGLTSRITPSTSAPNSSSLVPTITVLPTPFIPGRRSLTSQYVFGSGSPAETVRQGPSRMTNAQMAGARRKAGSRPGTSSRYVGLGRMEWSLPVTGFLEARYLLNDQDMPEQARGGAICDLEATG